MHADPKSAKKTYSSTVFFAHLGSACLKVECTMFVKLTLEIIGAKGKYTRARSLGELVSPTKQRQTLLVKTHLKVTTNFYTLHSIPYAIEISVNLLAKKLIKKC